LHLLLQRFQRLIDIVVAYNNLDDGNHPLPTEFAPGIGKTTDPGQPLARRRLHTRPGHECQAIRANVSLWPQFGGDGRKKTTILAHMEP